MQSTRTKVQRVTTLMFPFLLLLVAVIAVPMRVFRKEGLPRFRTLQAEVQELRARNEVIRAEVRRVYAEVQALRADPLKIEQIARDDLGMVRDDEILFKFPE